MMAEEIIPAVQINNLTKIFPVPFRKEKVVAVDDLSLRVEAGEVYGLIGPNGSGKSTTMKVLLGLISATSGSSAVFGLSSSETASRGSVGFLPENPYFYKYLTGAETLSFYGKLCGLSRRKIKERTSELLSLVDLENAKDRRLGGYSKGMLQRIGLAQALIGDPRLVVLDEPTAGVDPAGSRKIRDLIIELKQRGISVILSSHLLEQVQEVCDRVGIIFQGKLVKEGKLEELIEIESQTEIILEHADPKILDQISELVQASEETRLLRSGKPKTTLERLFLKETGAESEDVRKDA
ncbi:ABC transporter ATP-binding protein [Verrucomicrobiales bacterium]|nr:ABC transporter ATP-binding protein [Verrucomicrobiales bacterium]|tara:strand:+ start:875 stop:1759 length:885 start_codon:yes stop_codon:yes gene_type:complete